MQKRLLASLLALIILICSCDNNKTEEPEPSESPPAETQADGIASGGTPLEMPTVQYSEIFSEDFESGSSNFTGRGDEIVTVKDGCLLASQRTAGWHGPKIDITALVTPNEMYEVTAMIKFDAEEDIKAVQALTASLELNAGGKTSYSGVGRINASRGEWTEITAGFTAPEEITSLALYFEGGESPYPDIYLDDVIIKHISAPPLDQSLLPSIHEFYADYFPVGIAVVLADIRNKQTSEIITRHFNSITMGNEMKPDSLLDYAACAADPEKHDLSPAIRTAVLDECLTYARDNNLGMRGHTLVWHSQTPLWFFKEGYSQSPDAPYASREVMLARMENYIKAVLTHCQENFPGVIYAWDVLNEAIDPPSADASKIRDKDNPWYDTVGADYAEMAFVYARQYADPEVKLFYNDYNEWRMEKLIYIVDFLKVLQEKGLVDGMGLQAHVGIDSPIAMDYQEMLLRYAALGLEIQVTELDVNLESNTDEDLLRLATRYKRLMTTFRHCVSEDLANITNVTVWGISDRDSWLNGRDGGGRRYPLLFDDYLYPKKAFWGFILDDEIPNY